MMPFSAAELAAMQATQESAMQDTCVIQTWAGAQDAAGQIIGTWTDGTAQDCGFKPDGGREVQRDDMTTVTTDATVRLPVGTVVDMRNRIKITHRFGVAITAQTFEIVGPVRRGPSGVQLDLQRIDV